MFAARFFQEDRRNPEVETSGEACRSPGNVDPLVDANPVSTDRADDSRWRNAVEHKR
jgi:hypothetical protein